jgi:F420-0:gamma-glutamyl ligase
MSNNTIMRKILIIGLKSKLITSKDSLIECLKKSLKKQKLHEKDIIIITSKVVAITQGRIKTVSSKEDFNKLVKEEADFLIGGKEVTLTKKNNIFIPWAGIDQSNIPKNKAVLWPDQPFETAFKILKELKSLYKVKKLGLIITDSTCMPLRRGVTAVTIGYAGFQGVKDLRGSKDLYGKKMPLSQQNMADMIAVSAHLVMGEGTEQMPFAIVKGVDVEFTNKKPDPLEAVMRAGECVYNPLYLSNQY